MSNYLIRPAHISELTQLPSLERAASIRFLETPYAYLAADEPSVDEAYLRQQQAQGLVWVAATADPMAQLVGFVVAEELDESLYIHELDVLPAHGQRGLGRRLVEAVCQRARAEGYSSVTLATFRDVAWNAPFYAGLGFQEIAAAEMTPDLQAIQQAEATGGLAGTDRVLMRLTW